MITSSSRETLAISAPRTNSLSVHWQGSQPEQVSLTQPLGLAVGQSPLTDHNLNSQRLSTLPSNKWLQTLKATEVWQSVEELRLSTLLSYHRHPLMFANVVIQLKAAGDRQPMEYLGLSTLPFSQVYQVLFTKVRCQKSTRL